MLCDKKHSHVQWRDFKMNVLVCDDDQQIVDSIIEELKKKSEETHIIPQGNSKTSKPCSFLKHRSNCVILNLSKGTG